MVKIFDSSSKAWWEAKLVAQGRESELEGFNNLCSTMSPRYAYDELEYYRDDYEEEFSESI